MSLGSRKVLWKFYCSCVLLCSEAKQRPEVTFLWADLGAHLQPVLQPSSPF